MERRGLAAVKRGGEKSEKRRENEGRLGSDENERRDVGHPRKCTGEGV